MGSFTPSAIALGIIFAIAVSLTLLRSPVPVTQLKSVNHLVLIACGAQLVHFLEEAFFNLNVRLPEEFGFPAMTFSFFVFINISALLIWLIGAFQRKSHSFVVVSFWFLGLASMFNLIAHPAMAVAAGEYFPGLFTSPLVGVTGILLTRRLLHVTGGRTEHETAA